jgi:hypothetical protein
LGPFTGSPNPSNKHHLPLALTLLLLESLIHASLGLIFVACLRRGVSEAGGAVAAALHAALHELAGHGPALVHLPHQRHHIQQQRRQVKPRAKLARRIVVREGVVVVVEALAECDERDEEVFGGVDEAVVRLVPQQVRDGVDAPGEVQGQRVAQHARYEERHRQVLVPPVPRDHRRQHKAQQHDGRHVQPAAQWKRRGQSNIVGF